MVLLMVLINILSFEIIIYLFLILDLNEMCFEDNLLKIIDNQHDVIKFKSFIKD